MALKFPERGPLNLPALSEEWLAIWDDEKTFEQSVTTFERAHAKTESDEIDDVALEQWMSRVSS